MSEARLEEWCKRNGATVAWHPQQLTSLVGESVPGLVCTVTTSSGETWKTPVQKSDNVDRQSLNRAHGARALLDALIAKYPESGAKP